VELVEFEGIPWLSIAKSRIGGGEGLFAEKPFGRGELLVRFGAGVALELPLSGAHIVRKSSQGGCLDMSNTIAGKAQWHSEPNAEARGMDGVYARRDIADGDEITISYGWSRAPA